MPNDTSAKPDYELVHGVTPLHKIREVRQRYVTEYAQLWGLFGPPGLADHRRKALLAAIGTELRDAWQRDGRKFTEASLDEAARADQRYRDALDEFALGAARYMTLRLKLDSAAEESERGNAILRLAAAEARLG